MARLKSFARRALMRGGRALAGSARARRTVVLCYHSIHPDRPYASASPSLFAEHLSWLAAHTEIVDFADAYRAHDPDPSRPRVAITFDDGYEDNWTHAAPLLDRFAMPATFFVTTGFVARDPAVMGRFAFLHRGAECHPLSWSQVRGLRAAGHRIGAHTWSHPVLSSLTRAAQVDELSRAKTEIEQRLGEEVTTVAYPFGKPHRHFDARTAAIARDLGYDLGAAVAFRAVRDDDDRFAVPRFFVAYDDVASLAAKVRGDWDALGWWQERAPRWLARMTSPQDFAWVQPCA